MNFDKLIKRRSNQDQIEEISYSRVGISLAASWSWGVSMITTVAFMYKEGLIPTLFWVAGNILAMPLFAFVKTKFPEFKGWINFIPLILFSLFIGCMAIIMNMQALLIGLGGGQDVASYRFLNSSQSIPIIIIFSLAILIFIYRYGLRGSVLTDLGYYSLQMVSVVLLAVLSILISDFTVNSNLRLFTPHGMQWIFPLGFLGIISGVFTDPMMWQRFEQKKNTMKLGLWGGFWFGIYMFFVVIAGLFFKPNLILGILLLTVIFALATSTIGSAVASMQYLTNKIGIGKTPGLVIALAGIIAWPYLMNLGMASIWGIYAGYRWKVVTCMIIISYLGHYIIKKDHVKRNVDFLVKAHLLSQTKN